MNLMPTLLKILSIAAATILFGPHTFAKVETDSITACKLQSQITRDGLNLERDGDVWTLGTLVDARSGDVLPSTLWSSEAIANYTQARKWPNVEEKFQRVDGFEERLNQFRLSIEGELRILLAKFSSSASITFGVQFSRELESLLYSRTQLTVFEFLTEDLLRQASRMDELIGPAVARGATHVVTAIQYGAGINVDFKYKRESTEFKVEVTGSGIIGWILRQLDSSNRSGPIQRDPNLIEVVIASDVPLNMSGATVTSADEASQILRQFPTALLHHNGGRGVPIRAVLTPLCQVADFSSVGSVGLNTFQKLSVDAHMLVSKLVVLLEESSKRSQELELSAERNELNDIANMLRRLNGLIVRFKEQVGSVLKEIITAVRSGVLAQSALFDLEKKVLNSPFAADTLNNWLDVVDRRVGSSREFQASLMAFGSKQQRSTSKGRPLTKAKSYHELRSKYIDNAASFDTVLVLIYDGNAGFSWKEHGQFLSAAENYLNTPNSTDWRPASGLRSVNDILQHHSSLAPFRSKLQDLQAIWAGGATTGIAGCLVPPCGSDLESWRQREAFVTFDTSQHLIEISRAVHAESFETQPKLLLFHRGALLNPNYQVCASLDDPGTGTGLYRPCAWSGFGDIPHGMRCGNHPGSCEGSCGPEGVCSSENCHFPVDWDWFLLTTHSGVHGARCLTYEPGFSPSVFMSNCANGPPRLAQRWRWGAGGQLHNLVSPDLCLHGALITVPEPLATMRTCNRSPLQAWVLERPKLHSNLPPQLKLGFHVGICLTIPLQDGLQDDAVGSRLAAILAECVEATETSLGSGTRITQRRRLQTEFTQPRSSDTAVPVNESTLVGLPTFTPTINPIITRSPTETPTISPTESPTMSPTTLIEETQAELMLASQTFLQLRVFARVKSSTLESDICLERRDDGTIVGAVCDGRPSQRFFSAPVSPKKTDMTSSFYIRSWQIPSGTTIDVIDSHHPYIVKHGNLFEATGASNALPFRRIRHHLLVAGTDECISLNLAQPLRSVPCSTANSEESSSTVFFRCSPGCTTTTCADRPNTVCVSYTDREPECVCLPGYDEDSNCSSQVDPCAKTQCGEDEYCSHPRDPGPPQHGSGICLRTTRCVPGERQIAAPSAISDRKCEPCPSGEGQFEYDFRGTQCTPLNVTQNSTSLAATDNVACPLEATASRPPQCNSCPELETFVCDSSGWYCLCLSKEYLERTQNSRLVFVKGAPVSIGSEEPPIVIASAILGTILAIAIGSLCLLWPRVERLSKLLAGNLPK